MLGQNYFQPEPGRFGVMPVVYSSGPIGGADFLGGASPLTANNTTIFRLGPVTAQSMFSRLAASALQVPADADGIIDAYVYKYSARLNAAVAVSGALNLEALTSREGSLVGLGSGVDPLEATFEEGDTIEIHVVNDSAAIDTQPTRLVFNVEMLVLR